jgi:hypothetical protein
LAAWVAAPIGPRTGAGNGLEEDAGEHPEAHWLGGVPECPPADAEDEDDEPLPL